MRPLGTVWTAANIVNQNEKLAGHVKDDKNQPCCSKHGPLQNPQISPNFIAKLWLVDKFLSQEPCMPQHARLFAGVLAGTQNQVFASRACGVAFAGSDCVGNEPILNDSTGRRHAQDFTYGRVLLGRPPCCVVSFWYLLVSLSNPKSGFGQRKNTPYLAEELAEFACLRPSFGLHTKFEE